MSKIDEHPIWPIADRLDQWRLIAEEQINHITGWLRYRNGPDFDPWHNLAAGLPALPGYQPGCPQIGDFDELGQLTIRLGIDCDEHHPGADSMVFEDVYRLILAAHTEDSADFHEQYPTSQAVDRAWIKALNTWAVLRKKVIGYGQPKAAEAATPAADDLTNHIPAKQCVDNYDLIKNIRELQRILKTNPAIRHYKPSPQRLMVHATDMAKWAAAERKQRWELIDANAGDIDDIVEGIEASKAEARKDKEKSGPPTSPQLRKLTEKTKKNKPDAT